MNFWDVHGCWFIFFLLLCPRLTMLLMGVCFMSWAYPVWFWIGWLLTPRLVIAIIATSFYWENNPILVILSWLLAFGGVVETKRETKYVTRKVRR